MTRVVTSDAITQTKRATPKDAMLFKISDDNGCIVAVIPVSRVRYAVITDGVVDHCGRTGPRGVTFMFDNNTTLCIRDNKQPPEALLQRYYEFVTGRSE